MTIGDAQVWQSLPAPETILGGGYNCPGCGVPFLTDRNHTGPERAVYTGIDVLFDGSLVLCESCVKYIAGLVDMVDMEAGKARTSDVRRAQRRETAIRKAADKVLHAKEAATALADALDDLDRELAK